LEVLPGRKGATSSGAGAEPDDGAVELLGAPYGDALGGL
jgi:hypothetical protein